MEVGNEFSHYRVLEHIGRGGMADVWSARDKRLNRTVAIKTIAPNLGHAFDPLTLFEREAKTIAGLEHPHILPIYEFGDLDNQLYIVMRYVSGGSLEDLVEEGPLSLQDFLRYARSIAQALEYAHNSHVVHLDLKPSNILLDSYQQPYLGDFGLAAVLGPEGRADNPGSGTLLYMAPEQLTSDVLDHRADIYSFSILLFHLLTGQLPFDATTPLAFKQLQSQEGLPEIDLVSPNLPPGLTEVLRKGTAFEAADRPPTVMELLKLVEGVVTPQSAVDLNVKAEAPESFADLSDMVTQVSTGADAQARREAQDIFNRAKRAWARGQGRFLLGVTHFMLVNDYYTLAEVHGLEVDTAGKEMLLRGAIEFDQDIHHWWTELDDNARRWVALHAVRSENAPARTRALQLLRDVKDATPPIIARQVIQSLQTETNEIAILAALETLAVIGQQPTQDAPWRAYAFSAEMDAWLAEMALTYASRTVIEKVSRTIARIRSISALAPIAEQQRKGRRRALWVLAMVRDEARTLPSIVSPQARVYTWIANTYRRIADSSTGLTNRFLLAVLGTFLGTGLNTYITYRAEALFTAPRWRTSIAIGLTLGVVMGALVLLADEVPSRLRGFWPLWARLLFSAITGAALGIAVWGLYTYLYLEDIPDWSVINLAGIGLAIGFILNTVFRLPGWAAVLITTICAYLPLYWAFMNFAPPVVYYDYTEQVYTLALPMCLLIALGGHAQAFWSDLRRGWAWLRNKFKRTTPSAAHVSTRG